MSCIEKEVVFLVARLKWSLGLVLKLFSFPFEQELICALRVNNNTTGENLTERTIFRCSLMMQLH